MENNIVICLLLLMLSCQQPDPSYSRKINRFDNGKIFDEAFVSLKERSYKYLRYNEEGKLRYYIVKDSIAINKFFKFYDEDYFTESDIESAMSKDNLSNVYRKGMEKEYNGQDSSLRSIAFFNDRLFHAGEYGSQITFEKNYNVTTLRNGIKNNRDSVEYMYYFDSKGLLKSYEIYKNGILINTKQINE